MDGLPGLHWAFVTDLMSYREFPVLSLGMRLIYYLFGAGGGGIPATPTHSGGYWRIGSRIRGEVLGSERTAYGKQTVVALSRRLS